MPESFFPRIRVDLQAGSGEQPSREIGVLSGRRPVAARS